MESPEKLGDFAWSDPYIKSSNAYQNWSAILTVYWIEAEHFSTWNKTDIFEIYVCIYETFFYILYT